MIRQRHMMFHVALFMSALALLGACAEEEELSEICEYLVDPSECVQGETGAEPGDDDTPPPCTVRADGHERSMYQCAGEFSASISFTTLLGDCEQTLDDPEACSESHTFGPDAEPYERSAVIACCYADEAVEQDVVIQYCSADLIEQICRSIPTRLQGLIDEGAFAVGQNQAQKLQNWLAENQQGCYETLYDPTDTPGVLESASWLVNGGQNPDWPSLDNFTITVDLAKVSSAALPAEPGDDLGCEDNDINNTEVFEDFVPTSPGVNEILYLSESSLASVAGPEMFGSRVSGTGRLQSQASSCVDPWCSLLEVTIDEPASHWTLEELELFVDGSAELTNGTFTVGVERSSVRLYQVGRGRIRTDDRGSRVFSIQAREAGFVISGVGDGVIHGLRWGRNSSPITAYQTSDGFVIDGFVIEHVEAGGGIWTLTIPPTTWN